MARIPSFLAEQASAILQKHFGPGPEIHYVFVPGRINLIGEHIDYHNLTVLPMAIGRGICIAYRPRPDSLVRAVSIVQEEKCAFALFDSEKKKEGSWVNYLLAAKAVAEDGWQIANGLEAAIASDLPPAAGLSSSSALLAGFTIALLRANEIEPSIPELMNLLPEGEQFVGTRGGGMDHAAILGGQAGCALEVSFSPLRLLPVPIPCDWCFLVAHSLTTAEKSGAARDRFNALRAAGVSALQKLELPSYAAALKIDGRSLLGKLSAAEEAAFQHVWEEALRVGQAAEALQTNDYARFGLFLNESHCSLRDRLCISNTSVDALVEIALEAGAAGARMTGAGFGGCVIALCHPGNVHSVREALQGRYYAKQLNSFDPNHHLFIAEPSAGALVE